MSLCCNAVIGMLALNICDIFDTSYKQLRLTEWFI